MLSVGSRDGNGCFERRKNGLGLGFGGGDKMEETELEEGEACYYQDDDTSFDPDTDLSYIDVRIQDILGHFQKDFEGGVSAENLGAKFGDYGSFLPTYQRSPSIWSHPKYPQRPQSCSTIKSPTTIPFEGLRQSSAVPSNAAIPVRPVAASNNAVAGPVASFTRKSAKIDACASAAQSAGVFSPKCEPMAESVNGTDQKTLKVRIKVSSDNVSAMRNAEIYSGLGLDVSPSSTLEESSDDSGMLSPTIRDAPDESPMTMVQIMTSSQIPGGCLLSPLSDFLLHLKEKDKPLLKDSKPRILQKSHQGGTSMIDSESPAVTDKGQSEKKLRAVEKNARSSESKNTNGNVVEDGIDTLLRKEIDIETPSGRGLVNSALKIPLLSSSRSTHEKSERQNYAETVKDSSDGASVSSKEPSRGLVKDIVFSSDSVKEEIFDSSSHHEIAAPLKGKLNSKSISVEKVPEDKKASSHKDQKFDPRKNGRGKIGIQSDASKEQKNSHKVASNEQGRVKKKSKGSQSNGSVGVELPKEKLKISSFIPPKEKKKHSKEYFSETQLEAVKPKKESSKTSGKGGSMGDLKMGPADSMIDSLHGYHKNKAKDSKVENLEREHHRFAEKSKGRPIGKKIENLSAFDAHTENVAVAPAAMGTGPISDAATGPVVPVLIQDNWVCCDSCEKWRLLPYGIDPDQLPKKWLCSMQTWLPGMNNCSYSEDETTRALYQVSVSQNSIQSQHDGAVSGITVADVQHIDQSQRPSMALSGVQKKNATKDISNAPSLTPTHLPNSSKKNQQSPLKSRSLNDVNQFILEPSHRNRTGLQHSVNPNEFAVEKQRHKQTEKHELLGRYSDGGNYIGNIGKHSKTKSKRESEQDGGRISKKIKTEGLFYTDGDRNGYSSSKFSKSKTRESSLAPGKLLKDPEGQASLDGQYEENLKATDAWEFDKMALSTKKRKVKQWQEGQVYPDAQMSRGHMPETSESERRKEKKPKLSKPEAKESSTSKAGRVTKILISGSRDPLSDAVEEESRGADEKKHQPGQCRETKPVSEVVDSLKKDSGYAQQPALAATSSSSKISGSRKAKANFEEVKGSPVESVSSSPFRISSSDKLTNARRNLLGKDNATNASFSIIGSPRRCSDVECDGGSDRSVIARKEKTSSSVIDSLGAQKTTDALVSNGTNIDPSPSKFEDHRVGNVAASSEQHNWGKPDNHYHANGSSQGKSGRFSSSRSREKQRGTKSDFDNGEIKVSDSFSDEQVDPFVTKSAVSLRYEGDAESHGHSVFYEEARDAKYGFPEKCTFKSDKDEKHFLDQNELKSKWFREDKRENRSKIGTHENSDVRFSPSLPKHYKDTNSRGGKMGTGRSKELKSHPQKNSQHMLSREDEKKLLLPSMVKHETQSRRSHHVISTPHKGNRSEAFAADAPGGDLTKISKQPRKPDSQDEVQDCSLRHSTPNGLVCRNASAPSPPIRKDISGQAAANNALKEAKDLKHTADRLKNGGADLESTSLYFQAALKFLHGASLLEPCNVESAKNGETTQSMLVYTDTAKLCDFCAHEYERCREMASAAMAYKCMEVARMRVVFSKHWIASKDRHELQAALQVVPPGDSPSSSASDLDNLNNHGFPDKVPVAKGVVASPQVASSHIIVAQNRPNFLRMLNYAQDVNSAMEAMTRSQSAFAAASGNSEDSRYGREGLSAVRRVLEFNFHDVEGLLRLVRLAMEVISR